MKEALVSGLNVELMRQQVKEDDDRKFDQRIARLQRAKMHRIIPHLWFDVASTECRDMFRDGHFYGCICLTQSVAEALAKFVLEVHKEKVGKQQRPIEFCKKPMSGKQLIRRLNSLKGGTRNGQPIGVLTHRCLGAFAQVEGSDRDDFHHLNKSVATDREKLEWRAEECLGALYEIESELFGFDVRSGVLTPFQPQYWPPAGKYRQVYLRQY